MGNVVAPAAILFIPAGSAALTATIVISTIPTTALTICTTSDHSKHDIIDSECDKKRDKDSRKHF
jgi:hypothetical protein